jgi:hypothetical protein
MYMLEGENMKSFKPMKRINGSIFILFITLICDMLIIITSICVNDYVLNVFLRIFLVMFNIYQLYYILQFATLNYQVGDGILRIISIFGLKQTKISFGDLENYTKTNGNISAIKLSGYGAKRFAIGRCVFNKIGIVNMNVTWNENIFYLKTKDEVYGISPLDCLGFENELTTAGIKSDDLIVENKKTQNLHKDNYFRIPFFLVTIFIIIFIARPLYLYYDNLLPKSMPLSFNVKFQPAIMGTNEDFVIKQLEYGFLNMALFFCMYYAAHLNAKYYKKSAYKYIYISLAVIIIFLIIQEKIIMKFS